MMDETANKIRRENKWADMKIITFVDYTLIWGKNEQEYEKKLSMTLYYEGTSLYIFEILCFIKMYKIYKTQYSDIHKYNTKGKQDLYVQLCNTARCKKV
jgi:hypothetical protein